MAQQPVKDNIKPQVCIIELGGTVGDIEGMPFVESFRQFQFRVKVCFPAPSSEYASLTMESLLSLPMAARQLLLCPRLTNPAAQVDGRAQDEAHAGQCPRTAWLGVEP